MPDAAYELTIKGGRFMEQKSDTLVIMILGIAMAVAAVGIAFLMVGNPAPDLSFR